MSDEAWAQKSVDEDFQRWYVGGSPPESDDWPRHAFEQALIGRCADVPPIRDHLTLIPGPSAADNPLTRNNTGPVHSAGSC